LVLPHEGRRRINPRSDIFLFAFVIAERLNAGHRITGPFALHFIEYPESAKPARGQGSAALHRRLVRPHGCLRLGRPLPELSRLLVVAENYPGLKANQAFQDLRVQLEGTENRVTVARNRYIDSVQQYNVLARSFPSNLTAMVFGYQPKPGFTVADEAAISTPPKVDFGGQGGR